MLIAIPTSNTFEAFPVESKIIIHAILDIMHRFYTRHTSTIFITEQSLPSAMRNESNPLEIAGEMIRIASEQASMAYVIENNVTLAYEKSNRFRFYNIFFIDTYESFR